jgi:hypothetical protein
MAVMPLPQPVSQSESVVDAASNTVVLAFDLLDGQISNMPAELAKGLQSPVVQTAIKSALMNFALAKQKSGTTVVSDQEAAQLAHALFTDGGGKLANDVLNQLKNTPEYKKLEESLNDFQDTLKSSPLGVWVDRNKGILYVVGAGLALGGAAALYVTKTGGPIVSFPASQLTGKPVQIFKIGKFALSGQLLNFQPDTRTLGGALTGTEKWDKLQVSLQLGLMATGSDVKQVSGPAIFKTQDIDVTVTGSAQPAQKTVNLGLSVGITGRGLPGPLTIGVNAVVKDSKPSQGQLSAGLKTPAGAFGLTGTAGSGEVKGLATWTIPF